MPLSDAPAGTVSDFIAGMVNRSQHGVGSEGAASETAAVLRGPGAEDIRQAVRSGDLAGSLEKLATQWESAALASVAVAVRTGGVGKTLAPFLLGQAQREAAVPSAHHRTVADFVAVFLDQLGLGSPRTDALQDAAKALRGPGAHELVEAAKTERRSADEIAAGLATIAEEWRSPLLASLATAYRAGGPGPTAHAYLLAGTQAVASASWATSFAAVARSGGGR